MPSPAQLVGGLPPKGKMPRLGKIVTQIEMSNPESRKFLKDALE